MNHPIHIMKEERRLITPCRLLNNIQPHGWFYWLAKKLKKVECIPEKQPYFQTYYVKGDEVFELEDVKRQINWIHRDGRRPSRIYIGAKNHARLVNGMETGEYLATYHWSSNGETTLYDVKVIIIGHLDGVLVVPEKDH